MSSFLLQKTLKLDEDEHNIRFKLNSRQKRHSIVQKEKEMLKTNGDLYTLNLESGELKKKPIRARVAARKIRAEKMSVALAKQGFSLVDQYRKNKPKDIEARNMRYLEFVEQAQINDGVLSRITEKDRVRTLEKKAKVEKRRDLRALIRRDKAKKPEEGKSIFSDADFAELGGAPGSLLDHFKRIK